MRVLKIAGFILGLPLAALALIAAAYAIWPLAVFNLLMLKDPAQVIARDISYGPNPRQHYDLYAPNEGKNLPILVFVHGGSWNVGTKEGYDFVGHAFASRGYLTAMLEYRLVPDVRYPGFVADVATAVAKLRADASLYGADNSRVYLVGHSAGAYNVMQAALNPAFAPEMQQVRAVAGISGPYGFQADTHPTITEAFGQFQPFEDTQPAKYLRKGEPPIILLHGKDDDVVPPESSLRFHESIKAAGAESAFKLQPKTTHISILGDLSRPFRWRSTTFQDIIAFFAAHP